MDYLDRSVERNQRRSGRPASTPLVAQPNPSHFHNGGLSGVEAVLLEAVTQLGARQAQQAGGVALVVARPFECLLQQGTLDLCQRDAFRRQRYRNLGERGLLVLETYGPSQETSGSQQTE